MWVGGLEGLFWWELHDTEQQGEEVVPANGARCLGSHVRLSTINLPCWSPGGAMARLCVPLMGLRSDLNPRVKTV